MQTLLNEAWRLRQNGQVVEVQSILEQSFFSPRFNETSPHERSQMYLLQAALKLDQMQLDLASKYIDLAQSELRRTATR